MDTIISNQETQRKPVIFVIVRTDLSIADPGTFRLGDAEISAAFPPLCRPDHIIADPGTLRLRDAEISALFALPLNKQGQVTTGAPV
jgi:hypothetical protein